jgi:diguanylate cyclase (GGDEF)-like protein/PAS domain S-box-containing protein
MNYDNISNESTNQALDDTSVSFDRRLAYDKLTFFYLSLPVSLIGQLFGALLLSALLVTSVDVYTLGIWLTLNIIMFLYRFYHYYAFKNANEYTKLTEAKIWLHKFYTNVFISGMVWGSSAVLIFPDDYLAGQMVIVLFLFAISFTSMGVLASKKDLLLGYTLVMFTPVILRFFFLDGGEEYTTIAFIVIALMLILLLIAYYFGGVVNNSLRNHQYFIEIKHTHDQLKERFFSLFERAPVGIYYYDRDLNIQDVNAQFLSMHRVAFKEDLIGQEIGTSKNKILVDAHSEVLKNHTGNYRGPYKRFFVEDMIYVDLSTVPMLDNEGEVTGGITIIKDITDEVTAKEEMLRSAYYDMLTEIPNRTLLMDKLNGAIALMNTQPGNAALLFIDIDHFKKINDTYGHNVGDTVIKQVAYRIEEVIGEREMLARIGGDKFVVMLPELGTDVDSANHDAMEKALEIKRKFVAPIKLTGEDYHTSISIGIAMFNGYDGTAFDILKRAETAMYHAKTSGRNTVSVYKESMGLVTEEQLVLENELFKALRGSELQVFYQPQMSVSENKIFSAEALVRWFHPVKGPISPEKFIKIAEESGMIVELENWIFERIFMEMKQWSDDVGTFPLDHIAINVSAIHFLQPHFVEQFMMLVKKHDLNPEWIELELTESELMHNVHEAIHKIEEMRTFGITFSIDDFGTGYSSFAYLKQLPVDVLKIDQAFVLNMADNHEDAVIVSAMVDIAKKFGIQVLAEGVESANVLDLLREMGCDSFQGYYAYKPMPMEPFQQIVNAAASVK